MAKITLDPAKQKRNQHLIADAKVRKGQMPELQTVIPKDALPHNYTEDDYYRTIANVVTSGVHRWYIGRVDLPPETKVDWGGLKCRDRWIEYTGNLSHPDLEKILSDINSCMNVAAVAAIGAGLLTGNVVAATAAFKIALVPCLEAKGIDWANQITMWIDQDQKSGNWYYCL